VLESSTDKCPHCGGTGHMRSVSSVALQLLRSLEETLLKGATHNQVVRTRPEIAQYVLNHKRAHLMALEQRFHISIAVNADPLVGGQPGFSIERGEQVMSPEQAKAIAAQALAMAPPQLVEEDEPDIVVDEEVEDTSEEAPEYASTPSRDFGGETQQPTGEREGRGRRRRRRRGRGGSERREHREHSQFGSGPGEAGDMPPHQQPDFAHSGEAGEGGFAPQPHGDPNGDGEPRRRRRGRRGGRRNRRNREGGFQPSSNGGDQPHAQFDTEAPGSYESDVAHDSAPAPYSAQPAYAPRPEPAVEQPAPPAPEPVAAPEAPRRRSTVREPAPIFGEAAPAPVPTASPVESAPVVTTSTGTEDTSKPRRTGWWAKRMLGDKS
jgi:ribonuclease E